MRLLLNLLPPQKKAELRLAFLYSFLQSMALLLLIGVSIGSFSLLSARFMMKKNLSDVSRRNAPETQEFKTVSETIKSINAHMTRLEVLNDQFNDWTRLLLAVEQAVPPGVVVAQLTVAPTGSVTLSGDSETRDGVLALRRNLESNSLFRNIQSPLSNILQRTDVRFEFTMDYVAFREPAGFVGTAAKKKK
jgi:Tfp pilus assembly protein PilN